MLDRCRNILEDMGYYIENDSMNPIQLGIRSDKGDVNQIGGTNKLIVEDEDGGSSHLTRVIQHGMCHISEDNIPHYLVPKITKIMRPFQMNYSSSNNLTVTVHAGKDSSKDSSEVPKTTPITYRFEIVNDNNSIIKKNSIGGFFSPQEGVINKIGDSYPEITTIFTAPDNGSEVKIKIRTSNPNNNGVISHFSILLSDLL